MKTLSPLKASLFAILASSAVLATTVNAEPTDGGCDFSRSEFHKGDRMEHGGRHMDKRGMHRMFEGLDLTDAQKADIKKLFADQKAARADSRPTKEQRLAHRTEMQALMTAPNFDEVQAKALMSVQQEQRQAQAIERMKLHNQIYNLLTPEQQAKFKARFEAQAGKEPRG
ncbi:MAG: Spy/CpxP family protein refolding chaperone [Gammaproteobacteria bacterium]|nr:Spy/CpxP family protein refolding chaperone [Gammaproteobacteria bacterium]MBU1477222.1 Spy/CpxP family protein refolding chaperone [Gammaproteobacteria bacterium]MBU2000987.1 Spy/CpxP family protein refolding chaperone [Gammaproteobacteria bacterium]MBU2131965.1 Spy/CpxP family protein refolding chaperone [Gammaproteobacteria bacterium]MBU2188207.1 Spy/CpxP family protein refolding chaperone [Gammaproteobacteria bacterium]